MSLVYERHMMTTSNQLKVSTSDGSAIIAKIPDLDVPLLQLHECLENWGVVGIKGASGPNRRTYVKRLHPCNLKTLYRSLNGQFI
ncbi:hypothetical protein Pst134EA_032831 [Puccinia striiformis f. sp. tritici]|uniref:uncharacterized protein n=1 Tax=Puccinia striiformis f. sp. tritici TaxID=168172 RepID=UPI0020080286|nr:uncharacterized protein Pst134EA_032831 [Puccinia striiformis f. sp. tritici]KAH9441604.1 hypothetical protein Pst134EA_032831 [Puccinia striiformis f. sp. tritici]